MFIIRVGGFGNVSKLYVVWICIIGVWGYKRDEVGRTACYWYSSDRNS
jgi:hypothetical protein